MESLTAVCERVCVCVRVCQSERVGDRGEYGCPQYGRKKSNIISCSHEQIIPPLVRGVIDPSIIQNVNGEDLDILEESHDHNSSKRKKTET